VTYKPPHLRTPEENAAMAKAAEDLSALSASVDADKPRCGNTPEDVQIMIAWINHRTHGGQMMFNAFARQWRLDKAHLKESA
jgi:hypothetical protein